jgi:REP element-mobilizing transposase RayT
LQEQAYAKSQKDEWGRGYFVATSGNVTDEVIMKYIKN